MSLGGLKSRCLQGVFLLGTQGENPFPFLLEFLGPTSFPWLLAFLHLQCHGYNIFKSASVCNCSPFSSTFRGLGTKLQSPSSAIHGGILTSTGDLPQRALPGESESPADVLHPSRCGFSSVGLALSFSLSTVSSDYHPCLLLMSCIPELCLQGVGQFRLAAVVAQGARLALVLTG